MFDEFIKNGNVPLSMDLLEKSLPKPKAVIGNTVEVNPRTHPGVNKPGGTGIVQDISYINGEYFYDVKYTVNGGRESKVKESIINVPNIPLQNTVKRRSLGDEGTRTTNYLYNVIMCNILCIFMYNYLSDYICSACL